MILKTLEDFLLIQETETQTLPFREWFLSEKEKAVKKKTRLEKHTFSPVM